jgi:hypothetical protein
LHQLRRGAEHLPSLLALPLAPDGPGSGCYYKTHDSNGPGHRNQMSTTNTTCAVPPAGWHCTRPAGHDGPCAAVPVNPAPASDAVLDCIEELLKEVGGKAWYVVGYPWGKGNWLNTANDPHAGRLVADFDSSITRDSNSEEDELDRANAQLAAVLRNAAPALLARVRQAEARMVAAEAQLNSGITLASGITIQTPGVTYAWVEPSTTTGQPGYYTPLIAGPCPAGGTPCALLAGHEGPCAPTCG